MSYPYCPEEQQPFCSFFLVLIVGSSIDEGEPLFKGCIKDFKLSGAAVPWEKMNTLKNVRINACPVNA